VWAWKVAIQCCPSVIRIFADSRHCVAIPTSSGSSCQQQRASVSTACSCNSSSKYSNHHNSIACRGLPWHWKSDQPKGFGSGNPVQHLKGCGVLSNSLDTGTYTFLGPCSVLNHQAKDTAKQTIDKCVVPNGRQPSQSLLLGVC
jgi:hypothetical protein